MSTLLVASIQKGAGKTALCAGLGVKFRSQGKKVGFLKPLRTLSSDSGRPLERDAEFMKQLLGLEESVESLCPALMEDVETAYRKIAQGKDVVLIEGLSELGGDDDPTRACHEMAQALDAKVIIVCQYTSAVPWPLLSALEQKFGSRFLGVVINGVPSARLASFQVQGVKVLGLLPGERLLLAVTVNELAQHLQAEVLNSAEKGDELVQNLMLGAMSPDPGNLYFQVKDNKAVIVRGDRADMQMAALETSTKCLVLTGGAKPIATILHRAEEKGVPLIATNEDTSTTVAAVEELLARGRFPQEGKLNILGQLLDQHFDFPALYAGMV